MLDGDPTEGALLTAARKGGFSKEFVDSHYRVIEEFPFDSARKMMTVIVEDQDRKRYIITKGAPDVLMQRSSRIFMTAQQLFSQMREKQKQRRY